MHITQRIRKAVTLLELVIAIALTSVVVGAATVIFYSMSRMSDAQIRQFSETTQVKKLLVTIDEILSEPANKEKTITVNQDVGNYPTLLFTITGEETHQYKFDNSTLTRYNTSTSEEIKVYEVKVDVQIVTSELSASPSKYEFVFKYGKDFQKHMSLVKEIDF